MKRIWFFSNARRWVTSIALVAVLLVLGAPASVAHADTHRVMNTNDSGVGSLRAQIAAASSDDTIDFDPVVFGTPVTITLTGGEILLDKNLMIDATSVAMPSISGNNASRVFLVNAVASVTLTNLAIVNGRSSSSPTGGGIRNDGTLTVTNCTFSGNRTDYYGGGIYNHGTAIVTNSTFSGNRADYYGGGIDNDGTLTVTNSTFSGNISGQTGGGIYNDGGALMVTNSTFSGNISGITGGGIRNDGTLTVTNSTFSGNSAPSSGGAFFSAVGTTIFRNTIVANSTSGDNCGVNTGTITNGGNNIDSGTSCGWGSTNGSTSNTDPQLGTLTNGVFPLNSNSPAIDGVTYNAPNGCPSKDERGENRDDLACDIGAYEVKITDRNSVTLTPSTTTMTMYGPARAGIQTTSGDPGAVTVAKVNNWTTQPGDAVRAWWELTPTNASGWTTNLELCYTDTTELNSLNALNLHLYRYNGTLWTDMGRTSASGNCVQVNGITGFSRWTLATGDPGNAPTAVTLSSFKANAPAFDLGVWFRELLGR